MHDGSQWTTCTQIKGCQSQRIRHVFNYSSRSFFLIGAWYKRHELVTRTAWFMISNDITGTISGLLGAGIGSLNGTGGYSGWCWILFIEGAMTCCAAVLAFFFLVPFPENAKFLAAEEKRWVLNRLQAERFQESRDAGEKITLKSVMNALTDWKVLISGVFYLAVCVAAYSISVFQPAILKVFGWSDLKSNLLTAPVRIASGIVSVCVGILSDKVKRRAPFVIGGFSISIMGNLLVMLLKNGNLRYMRKRDHLRQLPQEEQDKLGESHPDFRYVL